MKNIILVVVQFQIYSLMLDYDYQRYKPGIDRVYSIVRNIYLANVITTIHNKLKFYFFGKYMTSGDK